MFDQIPVESAFGYRSTAQEVLAGVAVRGKTVFVTGGYSGLGLETVRAFALAGARVFVGARRVDVAAKAVADIDADIEVVALDLGDPASIDACATTLADKITGLDILINNAAIMACPLGRDGRGIESQFAVNHLGPFQLTARLFGLLQAADGARVVCLSSSAHAMNGLDLDDVNFSTRPYDKWQAYAQSKTASALFALHLDTVGAAHGVRAFAVDPGGIKTPLQRHLTMEEQVALGWYDADGNLNEMFKTPEQGASTSVWAATSPLLDDLGGLFCTNCNIAAPHEDDQPRYVGVFPHVRDSDLAARLWDLSETMTGVSFPDT